MLAAQPFRNILNRTAGRRECGPRVNKVIREVLILAPVYFCGDGGGVKMDALRDKSKLRDVPNSLDI